MPLVYKSTIKDQLESCYRGKLGRISRLAMTGLLGLSEFGVVVAVFGLQSSILLAAVRTHAKFSSTGTLVLTAVCFVGTAVFGSWLGHINYRLLRNQKMIHLESLMTFGGSFLSLIFCVWVYSAQ